MSSLIARTVFETTQPPPGLARFHVCARDVAGLYLTETAHPPGYAIPSHAHPLSSLYLMVSGSVTEQFGRERVERKSGDLIFTPPDAPHSDVFCGGGGRCLMIELQPLFTARVLEFGELPTGPVTFRGPAAWLASRLHAECQLYDSFSPLIVEGIALEMVAAVCRERCLRPGLTPQSRVAQAREYLDGRFPETVSLAEVAQAVSLHPVYLARQFRQRFHCSVGEYLRRRRVEFACSQLGNSRKSLAEIATEAGFCDQAHFTRTFRQLTGLTPSSYRATLRS